VDDEIELSRLYNWQLGRFGALENAGDIVPRHTKRFRQARAVAHQTSSLRVLACGEYGRRTVASRQRDELYSSAEEIPISTNHKGNRTSMSSLPPKADTAGTVRKI